MNCYDIKNGFEAIGINDNHTIMINDTDKDNIEIVIHPSKKGNVSVRFAKKPYWCRLYLKSHIRKNANPINIVVDLGDEDYWGNINPDAFDDEGNKFLGYGNDEDGYREIIKITDDDGKEITKDDFIRDVKDFIVWHSEC